MLVMGTFLVSVGNRKITNMPILLYGSEAWTLTRAQEKSLDGTYTKMLRLVLGVSWRDKIILYGNLPKLSDKIRSRRLMLVGHCMRHPELLGCDLVTWEPEARRGELKRVDQSRVTCGR